MKYNVGKPIFVFDEYTELSRRLNLVTTELLHHCDKILYIDTLYAYDPQYSYRNYEGYDLFKRVFHKKIINAYDLWDYMQQLEQIVKHRRIEVIIVNALNLVFSKESMENVEEITKNALYLLQKITKKYNLITIVGNAPSQNENAKLAFNQLATT